MFYLVDTMDFKNKTESDIKFEDIKDQPITKIDEQIVKQLEFYFSDANLFNDKFLLKQINNDVWVDINVLLTFKRLVAISNDPTVIGSAVKKFPDSIVEVDELNTKIRRKVDNTVAVSTKNNVDEMVERSVYCKGFPKEATMDEILQFSAAYNNIVRVIQRKLDNKRFKGSVYLVFNSKDQAEKFLKLESVKYENIELKRMWQRDFLKEKSLQYQHFKAKEIEKKKIKNELASKKGYLIKADNVKTFVTIDNIKTMCAELNWQVDIVNIIQTEQIAWILLKPIKTAKDLLKNFPPKKNRLNIKFSIPEIKVEEIVLNNIINGLFVQ